MTDRGDDAEPRRQCASRIRSLARGAARGAERGAPVRQGMKAAPPSGIHADPTARPLQIQKRLRWTALLSLGAVVVAAGLLWVLAARAPIAIRFDGIDSSGVHLNPYGRFTIRNLTQRTIDWSVVIEAPSDPHLKSSQVFCSFAGAGKLQPGETAPFRALVAGSQGVPFRAVVRCHEPTLFATRLWLDLSEAIPPLKRLWNPTDEHLRLICSPWWMLTSEVDPECWTTESRN